MRTLSYRMEKIHGEKQPLEGKTDFEQFFSAIAYFGEPNYYPIASVIIMGYMSIFILFSSCWH